MAGEYNTLARYHDASSTYPVTTVVVDAAGGGDYTTIKAAVEAVNPTVTAPVRIYVRNGTYNEIQIDGKDYLTIEGESRDGAVMVSDGLRTDVDPVSGQRYVDMAQSAKHGWWVHHNMTFRNMTVRVNDVKYCFHIDSTGTWYLNFYNVKFEHSNGYPVGCGCGVNQILLFDGCGFEKLGADVAQGPNNVAGSHGIFWHNRNDQTGATRLVMINCQSINCGLANLFELGSEHTDLCRFDNCSCSGSDNSNIYLTATDTYWNGGGQGVLNVPYSINVLAQNWTPGMTAPVDQRPDYADHAAGVG